MGFRAKSCDMLLGLNHVEPVRCFVGRDGKLAFGTERDTDKATARRDEFRLAVEIGKPVEGAAAGQCIDDVQDAFIGGKGQPLWAAEWSEQRANTSVPIDAIDVI